TRPVRKADFDGVVCEAGGLEAVAEREEETGGDAEAELGPGEAAESAVVEGQEDERCERHAQEVEEEWGDVVQCGFDEREGAAPDEDDSDEEDVGEEVVVAVGHKGRVVRGSG